MLTQLHEATLNLVLVSVDPTSGYQAWCLSRCAQACSARPDHSLSKVQHFTENSPFRNKCYSELPQLLATRSRSLHAVRQKQHLNKSSTGIVSSWYTSTTADLVCCEITFKMVGRLFVYINFQSCSLPFFRVPAACLCIPALQCCSVS